MAQPIILNAAMVCAVLSGQKTQTRRPIKRENKPDPGFEWAECLCREMDPSDTPCCTCAARFPGIASAGDRLWVRETWDWRDWQSMANRKVRIAYAADGAQVDTIAPCDWNPVVYNAARWHPSIHMPRWASRITLPLVSVRVERVQDISEKDAWAEGYGEHWQRLVREAGLDGPLGRPDACGWFAMLWDKLYGTWGQNPWVWVAEWNKAEVVR